MKACSGRRRPPAIPSASRSRCWAAALSDRKEMRRHWQSWLTIFILSEDNNEGVFGPPPPTGNSVRISQQMLGRGALRSEGDAAALAVVADDLHPVGGQQ